MIVFDRAAVASLANRVSALWFAILVFCSRLLILLCIFALVRHHEFSNDVKMHMAMVRQPLGVLMDTTPQYQQHPPLLPLMEALPGYPLQSVLPDFLTLRLVMTAWETLLAVLFVRLLDVLGISGLRRFWCLVGFLLLPSEWLTSAVMAQDDPIAACGILLPLLFWIKGRRTLAALFSGIGFVAAKIFVMLELLCIIILSPRSARLRNAAWGFIPVLLIYIPMAVSQHIHGRPLPLVGFKPNPYYGTNFWMLLKRYAGLDLAQYGLLSGCIALVAAMLPPVLLLRRNARTDDAYNIIACVAASLMFFFLLFYHVEQEYIMLLIPPLLLTSVNRGDAVCTATISIVPWFGKFFQNAAFMDNARVNTGKLVILHMFEKTFHSSPEIWLSADQALFSLLALYVAWRWCRKLVPSSNVLVSRRSLA